MAGTPTPDPAHLDAPRPDTRGTSADVPEPPERQARTPAPAPAEPRSGEPAAGSAPTPAPLPLNPGGSFLRDRMANERTLLAWVRTALTLVALGLALAKLAAFLQISVLTYGLDPEVIRLLPDPRLSDRVAAALILLGGAVAAIGAHRSWQYARIIDPQGRAPRDEILMAFAGGTVVLSLVLLLYVLSRG
ncbi:MAG: DUF202 domain-containing protein [Deltaproteobacteria bacterium]|nr:MAG: DUF202 domain-containing protein [Deltaproteobacteria bacterium]